MRIVFAAEGWHLDYVPLASASWRRFFPEFKQTLAVVMDKGRSALSYQKQYGAHVDEVVCLPDIDDVCRAALAKMARIYVACTYGSEVCTLHDIDFCPMQRGFYESKYQRYVEGRLMLMGAEVYQATEPGRVPSSAMSAPGDLFRELYDAGKAWDVFVDDWRKDGRRTPDNKDDVLNAVYFSDEIVTRTCLNRKPQGWISDNVQLVGRGYNIATETIDRVCWNLADWQKMLRGEYLEAHLLKAYRPNIIVNDKEFDAWGFIPGLKPILDYFAVVDPYEQIAISEAMKLYGEAVVDHCLNWRECAPGEVWRP